MINIPFITDALNLRKAVIAARKQTIATQTAQVANLKAAQETLLKNVVALGTPGRSLNAELYATPNVGFWGYSTAELRRRSRIAYWESAAGRSIIGRFCDVAIGQGLELQAAPMWQIVDPQNRWSQKKREQWTQKTEYRFWNWAKSKDIDTLRERDFYQLISSAYFNKLIDGETFAMLRYSPNTKRNPLSIQIIPGENITGGNDQNALKWRADGIEFSDMGAATGYFIRDDFTGKTVRVSREGMKSGRTFMLHSYRKISEKMRRGVPLLSLAMPELTKLSDLFQFELQAVLLNSMIAAWVEPPANSDGRPVIPKNGIVAKTANRIDDSEKTEWKARLESMGVQGGGIIIDELPAGHKIQSFDVKRPAANFESFCQACKRQIMASCDIPLSVVEYNFSQSYSGARGELLIFWNTVMRERDNFASDIPTPVYTMWLWGEIDNGNIECPGWDNPEIKTAWAACRWIGSQRPDIDPLKSVAAHKQEWSMGWRSGASITSERGGGDYAENIRTLVSDAPRLADAMEKYNAMGKVSNSTRDGNPATIGGEKNAV
jgi:lambda family phage portal protein